MVRRIEKADLRVGMFVEAVEGLWQDNPHIGRRFRLNTQEEVERLKSSNVTAVYINRSKSRAAAEPASKSPRFPRR